jgi:hypothetical protein
MSVIDVGTMPDGRFQVFRIRNGDVITRWNAREGGWSNGWQNMGKPGSGAAALRVAHMKDGRMEVFVVDTQGAAWNTWQRKEGGWFGSQPGKVAGWQALG